MTRRPKGYDPEAWNRMGPGQREATAVRAKMLNVARARRDRADQRAEATYFRRRRLIEQQWTLDKGAAERAYREIEDREFST